MSPLPRRRSFARGSTLRITSAWAAASSLALLVACTSDDSEAPPQPGLDGGIVLDAARDVTLFDASGADGSHDATTPPDATLDAGTDSAAPDATTEDAEPDVTIPDATAEDAEPDAAADAPEDAPDDVADASCGEGGPVGTFSDDFSQGLRAKYWTVTQINPGAGVYAYADDGGAVHFSKVAPSPGGTQNISANLNMAAVGGPVMGDFTMTVDFHDAVRGANGGIDQFELHANFEDSSYFFDVYSNEGGLEFHVWDGAFETGFTTAADAATLQIVRVGSTLSAYAITRGDAGGDGGAQTVFSKTGSSSPLASASFILQNFNGNDDISVTYDNFSLRGARVHP